eukprot:Gb_27372 [translate_table: standard]
MDNQAAKDRTVLTVVAETDPSRSPGIASCQFQSVAILSVSQSQILVYLGTENGRILLYSWDPSTSLSVSSAVIPSSDLQSYAKDLNLLQNSTNSLRISSSSSAPSDNIILLASRTIGDHAIEAMYPLQESNKVAAMSDNLVFLFDLYLVDSIQQLTFTRGASAMTRRMLSPKNAHPKALNGESDLIAGIQRGGVSESDLRLGLQRQSDRTSGKSGESSSRGTGQAFLQRLGGVGRTNGKPVRSLEAGKEGSRRPGNNAGVGKRERNAQLAVAVGKRLLLCEILSVARDSKVKEMTRHKQSNLATNDLLVSSYIKVKEIPGAEGITTMAWLDNALIVGTAHGYMLIAVTNGQVTPIFSLPDSSDPPLLKSFAKDCEALLLIDNVGIVVNTAGQPTAGSLLFKYSPDSLGQTAQYVVVGKRGQLELYHRKTGSRVQSLSLTAVEIGHSVIADDNDGEFVVVATESKVSCLRQVPVEEQLKELLRQKEYDEAVCLAEEFVKEGEGDCAKERLSLLHAQAGFLLLFDMQFKEAVDHFLQSEVMQPSEIFPFIMPDPNRWSTLVPRNRYWGLHPPPQPLEVVIENWLLTIQRGFLLKKAGVATGKHVVGGTLPPSPSSRSILLESAIQNIIRYLKASRNKDLAPLMKEGVDTLLMYLYRVLELTEEMEQLASSENSCVVEELEALLQESGHLPTLAFLCASKGMQSRALDIWRVLAWRNLTIPLQGSSVTRKRGKESSGLVSDQLAAATEASRLLEESSDHNLVLQHLTWILEMDQDLVVKVLTSSKRSRPLPPEEVFSAVSSDAVDVHQRYLQWLIEDQRSEDARFHTLYALSLTKTALDIDEDVECRSGDYVSDEEKKTLSHNGCIDKELHETDAQNGNQLKSRSVRERLQLFLLSSDKYDAEAVLNLIKGSRLWSEQAILYRKLGEETSVLQILALKLEDSEAAEQYCAELGRPDAYMQLLDMYLEPGDGREPMYKAAVRLLHCHGESLDPLQVLEALSPDMPLQLASETLSRMLRARVHHHRQGQIVQNLSRAVNLDARLSRFEERSRHVQINDESLCDSCHARLGTKLFAMYPNDLVVCYKCFRRYGEHICPITGHDFGKDPIFKPSWLVRNFE